MSQLTIKGHALHGRLDDSYSVSDLRKPRPLYNFRLLDSREDAAGRHQLMMPRNGCYGACSSSSGGLASDDSLLQWTEFGLAAPSKNNSAAMSAKSAAIAAVTRCQRQLRQRQKQQKPLSNRQLMESHLRLTYGNELFDGQQYIVKGRLGIAGLPMVPGASGTGSAFQAIRGRILGPVPSGTFADDDDEDDADSDADSRTWSGHNIGGSVFQWCDRNNSAEDVAKTCARRAGAKITMRRGLSKWVFLYFRVRRVSWEFMVYEEKMNCSTVDLFSENVLDRWTVKLRFKMLLDAPMKFPLMAFLSRMGLDTDPDIVFSVDGFFGDMLVGGLRNKNSIPHRQVSFNTTPEAMGLQNGENIFVVKANSTLRNNVEAHMEMAKRRANKTEGDDEDEEEEDADEEEEEHH